MENEKRRGRPKSSSPTKTRQVTFRMEEDDYQKFKSDANSKGLTVTEAVIKGIELFSQKPE